MKAVRLNLITVAILGGLMAFAPMSRAQETKDAAKPERPAAAQRERRGAGPAGASSFARVSEQLKLTADQKGKLQPIFLEELAKLRELRQDTALTPEQRREKVREIRKQYVEKMEPTLTIEQFAQLKKMREPGAARGAQGARSQRERPGARGDQKPQ